MPPRRKVTTFNKARAIAWLQDGVSKREVGRRLGVSHYVVVRLHQKFQATNSVLERPRSGRPKKTTQREDRFIRRQALQQRGATANIIRGQLRVATNTNVSTKTIRKRLHEVGLRSRRPAVRPRLTAAHRQARLAFCHNHARWTRQQWADVLFSDESRFNLHHHDGRARVWRRQGERYNNGLVQERVAFGGGSIMVAFSFRHRTPLNHIVGNLTGQRYRDEIVARSTPDWCDNFIQQAGVTRTNWPACSPDFNPIEHLWDELDRRVRNNHPPPRNLQQLLQFLQIEWQAIPQAFCRKLVNSMRNRTAEGIAKRGGHTHY
ncbi:hypothetical protein V1264_007565 [Littorina saxatilis]|uniref:Transposase Tc1-like domain-containing protein n=1 Tax=Littorina saxatilis TaxID=31220 RepID=A0AAN9AVL2_9CAEN